ncbi:TIGR02757 family protein [Halpernia frigidisoli]|uniref:TIGR02757 family protein n=1 Tax=Halpernia frigidisoli TaxID=1125876 RepID=A0A1I3F5I9_9FLAO|nr:TIGR02757 family protein [Halpernia frigidisoli]SFI06526.1 TIGR02757 family protein [Halpernia frigidisoli]
MSKKKVNLDEVFSLLNEKAEQYNNLDFIELDPISIPHRFSLKQDIEISGFLTATISWGNRKAILNSAQKMLDFMDNSPYDFIQNFTGKDLKQIETKALHRTFSGEDFAYFLKSLQKIYSEFESLEQLFIVNENETNFYHALDRFRVVFLNEDTIKTSKHVSSTYKNSAAKRLIMYLRWMVRDDKKGVDFGIWKNIDAKHLSIPLDVHTANISRELGLLKRTQNDWKAVAELDLIIRKYNPKDPAVYDFALFGMGVNKDF